MVVVVVVVVVVRRLTLTFENAKEPSILSKKRNGVISATAMKSLGEIVEATINHLNGNVSKGSIEGVSDIVSEVNEDRVKNPSAPNLKQNAMNGTSPKIGETENALDNVEGILNAPTLPVKGGKAVSRKDMGI